MSIELIELNKLGRPGPRTKWDLRFLEMAELVGSWSKDPSTKVGAVIVRPDKTIASVGFNGFPRGCSDNVWLYQKRELKLERILHAEVNAILSAKESLTGCILYTTLPTCARCTACIIQAGITRVVYRNSEEFRKRWFDSLEISHGMYEEADIEVTIYV